MILNLEDDNKDKKDKKNKSTNDDGKKKEPLLERYLLVDLDALLKQNSIYMKIPQLEKFLKSNAKVPAIGVDKEQYNFVLDDLNKLVKIKISIEYLLCFTSQCILLYLNNLKNILLETNINL